MRSRPLMRSMLTLSLAATACSSTGSSSTTASSSTGTTAGSTASSSGSSGSTGGSATASTSSGGTTGATRTVASLAVTPATGDVAVGATLQLTATATYSDATTADVSATATWTTSNAARATVSATGLVTGVAQGTGPTDTVTLTATLDGKSATSVLGTPPGGNGGSMGTNGGPGGSSGTTGVNGGNGTTGASACAALDGGVTTGSGAVLSNTAAVVTDAEAFLTTLSTTQQTVATSASSTATVLFPYSLTSAETWTNLPGGRHGLRLNTDTLTASQLAAAEALVTQAVSSAGHDTYEEIRLADDEIASTNANGGWGTKLYSIAFIGTPSTTTPWILQVTGHHLAFNISYNAPDVSATPMFIGVEPPNYAVNANGTYSANINASSTGTQHAPLETQRAAMNALVTSIQADATLATQALLSGTFTDVVMGVASGGDTSYGCLGYPSSGRGVRYSALSTTAQQQVKTAIEAWVNTQAPDIAASLLADYESATALDATYIGYAKGQGGTCDLSAYPNAETTPLNGQHSYVRIDGPRVWIEIVVQQGVAYSQYVHYHSLWRDKTADYGGSFH